MAKVAKKAPADAAATAAVDQTQAGPKGKAPKAPKVKLTKEEAQAKKAAEAAAKAKVAAEQARKKAEEKEARRKERMARPVLSGRAILLTTLAFLLLVAVASTLLFFNIGGSKQLAVDYLTMGESPFKPQIDQLKQASDDLASRTDALAREAAMVEASMTDIIKRERDATAREESLLAKEKAATDRLAVVESAEVELSDVVALYEGMAPASSASIMVELYDIEDIVRILSRMKQKTASKILESMPKATAARVTEALLMQHSIEQ